LIFKNTRITTKGGMDLIKCSNCHSTCSIEYFGLNRKNEPYKTCEKCRLRDREKAKRNVCEHGNRKDRCVDCGGKGVCEHKKRMRDCKICSPQSFCEHDRKKSRCVECHGCGICEHNKRRSICVKCGGSEICEHKQRRNMCNICDPIGHLAYKARCVVSENMKSKNSTLDIIDYIECDIETYRNHIEGLFEGEMSWDNYGSVWEIDHIIPIKYGTPSLDEVFERLKFTNTQPLLKSENRSKGNKYIGKPDKKGQLVDGVIVYE